MHLLHDILIVYSMIIYENKADLLARKILVHIARAGVYDLGSFSKLSKSIQIGRSLLYFYYKNESEIVKSVYDLFIYELDYHYHYIKQHQFNFDQCLTYLVDMKDLYFFIVVCTKVQDQRKEYQPFIEYTRKTINRYIFEQFTQKYNLENLSEQKLEYLYKCLRSYWFDCSGRYENWDYDKVLALRSELDQFVHGLKNDLVVQS